MRHAERETVAPSQRLAVTPHGRPGVDAAEWEFADVDMSCLKRKWA